MKLNFYTLLLLATVMLLFAGCRDSELKRMPDTLPDIRGNIAMLSKGDQNDAVTILVKAKEDKDITIHVAQVRVTEETKIEDSTGKTLSVSALSQGQEVDVWFGEKVMESFPVQADAIGVRIRSGE